MCNGIGVNGVLGLLVTEVAELEEKEESDTAMEANANILKKIKREYAE